MKKLKNAWLNLLRLYTADEQLILAFWQKIFSAYTEKGRHYHTLEHISQMIDSSTKYADKLQDIENLQFSIFYHDIVYSATKKNNEEKSADLAVNHLKKLNLSIDRIEKCRNYILATKNHSNPSNDPDLDFLLDFDLEKLGASWSDYEEYTKQIRKEYNIYPKPLYNKGREKVLKHFLAKERIYKTAIFFGLYEKSARENLERELALFS